MTTKQSIRALATVGGYRLLGPLGEGPTGTVFKARKENAQEQVAVKLVRPGGPNHAGGLQRFEQDCRASLPLKHPNLVKALDVGPFAGSLYVVRELVTGTTLAEHLVKNGRLKEGDAVRLLTQVGAALSELHRNELVHRNVKPENVFLGPDGQALLSDPGALWLSSPSADLDRVSGLTAANFVAPELFQGAEEGGPRCDVYALAATLYAALTGEVPFRAPTLAGVVKKKQDGDLTPAWALVPGLSERVAGAMGRALSPEPGQRQASVQELVADLTGKSTTRLVFLRRTQALRALPAAGPSYRGPERRQCRRYPSSKAGSCVPVSAHQGDAWETNLNDVSLTGASVTVSRRFEVGTILVLHFAAADGPGHGPFVARVMRQRGVGQQWVMGCAFTHPISEGELTALASAEGERSAAG
jgi:serine/threonine protein kinase